MKLKRTETHDRLLQFKKQDDYIGKGCQQCINNAPEEFTMPFYIFAHTRSIGLDERIAIYQEDVAYCLMNPVTDRKYWSIEEVPSTRLIWAPRLTKPKAQTSSMLFKAQRGSDNIEVIWIIPVREMWDQYKLGKMTESAEVLRSIHDFENDRLKLEAPDDSDLTDEEANRIYEEIKRNQSRPKFGKI